MLQKWIAFCLVLVTIEVVAGRKTAALDDICARGAYAFCPQTGAAVASAPAANQRRDLPQPSQSNVGAAQPPKTPFSATPPPLPTVGEYCVKYAEHYDYFCKGTAANDPKAGDFCPTYTSHCDVSGGGSGGMTPMPSELPPAKIQQVCTDYQAMANQYCFRPEIPKGWQVRKNCDTYLKYCVSSAADQLQKNNQSMKQVLQDNIKPCAKFQNDYIGFCVQNPTPYNNQVTDFCKNYKATCVPVGVPSANSMMPAADLPQQPQVGQSQAAMQQALLMQQLQQQDQLKQMMATQSNQVQQTEAMAMQQGQNQQGIMQSTNNAAGLGNGNPQAVANANPTAAIPNAASSPMALGNPAAISDPLGSLGNPGFLGMGNPSSAMVPMGNPGTQMVRGLQGNPAAVGAPVGMVPSGMAANPLSVGSSTQVGNIAGVSRGTAINPFGQVATGRNVMAGPVGIQSGSAVDFSGIPGLSQLGSIPGLGRRKRDLSLLMWVLTR